MLSSKSVAIVQATLPAVKAHAEAITEAMYRSMLDQHPELTDIFNSGNQANGEQRQALAASVVAGAQFLVGSDQVPFGDILARVAHKHASLGIRPHHYPVVARHLMGAVGAVLGEAVTPEVAAAWDEVYWLFACELVAAEGRLYEAAGVDPAAPWRQWRVEERIEDASDVVSFVLAPTDGGPVPSFRPGQYVSVVVTLPDGRRQPRQYTLSLGPGHGSLRITVRRTRASDGTPDGAVSTHLAETLSVGDEVSLSEPFGDVVLSESEAPVVLISAGVGVTPMVAMADYIARHTPDRQVVAVHADRSAAAHPLRTDMAKAGSAIESFQQVVWYEEADGADGSGPEVKVGMVDPAEIPLPQGAEIYMCGPLGFMRHVRSGLLARGVAPERIRYEVFGPDLWAGQPDADAA